MTDLPEERQMDARSASLLHRLLMVTEDLRYAWREDRLEEFCEDCIVENESSIAEKAGIPRVALVLPAPEMATLTHTGSSPPLSKPPVPPPATAWELAELLQRIVTDCKGVRGTGSPAAPRPSLLHEAEILLKRVARDDLTI